MKNLLSLFRRRPNPRVAQLIERIRTDPMEISERSGTVILYLKSGWAVASVNYHLVSIPEIEVTKAEERAICDAIADRLADHFRRP
jgi:hypothetical protein